jgi:probable F420-dependent oxidoreductase
VKFSVCLPTGFEGVMHPIPFVNATDFVTLGQATERLGYDSAWANDHITTQRYVRELYPNTPPSFYEALVTLTAVGMTTERLRLGTALLVLPMREPVYLAKQVATIDQLTGGRFILAVGIGAYREEFEAWNSRVRDARRGEMMDEALEALHLLFTERAASFSGKHYVFKDVELFPKPLQEPYPIWVGGHNLEAVDRAARWGLGWLPGWRPFEELRDRITLLRERAAKLGRSPQAIEIAPQFSVYVAKTLEEATDRYMKSGLVAHRQSLAYTGRDLSRQIEANLVGSPDVILEKVERLRSIGVDHCCALMFPSNTITEMHEQIQWFAEAVIGGRRSPARAATERASP